MKANYGVIWFVMQFVWVSICLFFLILGIQVLVAAYTLKDPFSFVMTFFASNFIILISIALMIGFFLRVRNVYKLLKNNEYKEDSEEE